MAGNPSLEFARRSYVPTLREKLLDRGFLNSHLHAQLIVEEVVGKRSRLTVDGIDANTVTVAIRTDQAYSKIGSCNLPDYGSDISGYWHGGLRQ